MSNDDQDSAESFDDDMIGTGEPVTSDEVEVDFPPDRPVGLPFAEADITDESFAQRSLQEEPEVSEADIDESEFDDSDFDRSVDVEDIADPDI